MAISDVYIGNHPIGPDHPPFVVAELSGNHNGSLDRALSLVDAVARTGAQALKIQTYTADTMTLRLRTEQFMISDPSSPWCGRSLYELYAAAHTPWEWHEPIFERCKRYGLVGFSTPFDSSSVAFLESLNVPCYKIASFENVDLPLIKQAAKTGRPVIISTGMATSAEIDDAVRTAREAGAGAVMLMKCTSVYPADASASNLVTIPHMSALTGCHVGLSDHTLGIGVAIAACGLGARLIEKHLTLRRADGGVDSAFSLEPDELAMLVTESTRAWRSLGNVSYGATADEKASLQYRRSLYVVSDVPEGGLFTTENVRAIRPGFGLLPKYLEQVIGRRASRPLTRGTPLSWELLK